MSENKPKIVVVDTGLAADLCGLGEQTFAPTAAGTAAGALFETFVITEVLKQATWSERSVDLSYFRDRDGAEVPLPEVQPVPVRQEHVLVPLSPLILAVQWHVL